MRWMVLIMFCLSLARANDVYLASTSAGSNNGLSCSNAKAYTYFNSSGNWSGTPSGIQIGPDTTVHICGTITDSLNGTLLTAQGGGMSGHPITINFEVGASLESPAETVFIDGGNNSYFVIDGGTTCGWINNARVTCNGRIRNTLNGGSGVTCPGGACSNTAMSRGVSNFLSNLEVRNLEFASFYVHGGTGDLSCCGGSIGAPGVKAIDFTTAGGSVNIHNNIFHDLGWALNGGGNSITIANNEFYDLDHGLGMGVYSDSPTSFSGVVFHDNSVHDTGTWDQDNNAFHHDGIHLFAYCGSTVGGHEVGCTGTYITNVVIYNNRFTGDWGSNNTAAIFFEANIQNAAIFNNVAAATGKLNNGLYNGYGSNVNYFNNTAIGPATAVQNGNKFSIFTGPGFTIQNNIWTDGGAISTNGPWPNNCPYTLPSGAGGDTQACQDLSYMLATNAYLSPADFGNGFGYINCTGASCSGNAFLNFNSSGFANFESGAPETGGIFRNSVATSTYLETTGVVKAGAPVIGTGTNLTTLCTGLSISGNPCLSDINGVARPASGAWDIGAYQYAAVSQWSGTFRGTVR